MCRADQEQGVPIEEGVPMDDIPMQDAEVLDGDDITADTSPDTHQHHHHMKNLIPTSAEEMHDVEEKHGANSWQMKAVKFINSHTVQRLLIAFLLIDVLILFVELFLEASYPSCVTIERDAISCCPVDTDKSSSAHGDDGDHGGDDGHRFLTEMYRVLASDSHESHGDDHHGHHSVCEDPLKETEYDAGCDSHKYPGIHTTHTVLFSMTVAILGIFFIELNILLICLGFCNFFGHLMYTLDYIVVTASLALELTFKSLDDETFASLAGLLVIARIWRFVRIGHGLVASAHEMEAAKGHEMKAYVKVLEMELRKREIALPDKPKGGHGHH